VTRVLKLIVVFAGVSKANKQPSVILINTEILSDVYQFGAVKTLGKSIPRGPLGSGASSPKGKKRGFRTTKWILPENGDFRDLLIQPPRRIHAFSSFGAWRKNRRSLESDTELHFYTAASIQDQGVSPDTSFVSRPARPLVHPPIVNRRSQIANRRTNNVCCCCD